MPKSPLTPIDTARSAVLALFVRLGARPAGEDDAAHVRFLEGVAPEPGRDPGRAECRLRRRAHAAYATVQESDGPAALDMALDVLADELDAVRGQARNQAEALKAIRLYAPDPWVRRIAQQALAAPERPAPLPTFLIAPEETVDD